LYRRWESQAQQELNVRSWSALQEGRQQAQESVLAIEKRITDLWHTLLIRNADYAQEASLWQIRSEPIQPFIPEGALLLEYFIAYDNIYLFLVDQTQIKVTRLSTDLGSVQKHIQLLWHNMRLIPRVSPRHIPALTKNAEGILFQLYQDLLAGVEDDLASFERLIVVPHGPLHYLPFHALHDGQEYLLERFEIGYLPGGSFLRFIKPADPGIDGVLVGANSFEGRLPHTHIEADRIAGLWGTQPLLEGETTLERITTLAPASRAIHLATHGDFRPDNPLFSGLALADGWLTTLSIFNLRLQASLVTLSACETGRNVISGGDELLGLMRAFLSAGAASLVLSLWAVEDRSTAHLMEAFYSGLKQGLEKGEALRAAQRLLLNGQAQDEADLRQAYRHPYFWAPFILVGHSGAL
jgi:CHAT domain-containing protein